jgi:HK97 family phage major capsid protein
VPFNNLTSRTDGQALIPEQVVNDMLAHATKDSAALTQFRRVPVAANQVRFPILSALPMAYWVTGDTGLKQTSEVAWANKYLNIEEIAVIVPIPENVVDDMSINVWDEVSPYMAEAVGRTLDSAIFFGANAPASFPTNVAAAALAAGNAVTSIPTPANGGYMGALDSLYGVVEQDGFVVNALTGGLTVLSKLRAARNVQGDKTDPGRVVFSTGADGNRIAAVDGLAVNTDAMQGMYGTASGNPELFGFQRDQFVLGVRKDVTYKLLDQAVIQDNTGAIIYNLAQQDMVALRLTFRAGWQVANTINYQAQTESARYPAGYIALP